jgi:hypothetical protein
LAPLKHFSTPQLLVAPSTETSILRSDHPYATPKTLETDTISVAKMVKGTMKEHEMDEVTSCAPSVLKVMQIAKVGVWLNLERVSVLRVLSASMAVWEWTDTETIEETIGDSRTGRIVIVM